MMEVMDAFCIFRSDATAEQERSLPRVSIEHRPVVFLSAAPVALAFCVEEEEVGVTLILLATLQVFCTGNADRFDDFYFRYDVGNERPPKVVDHHGTLITVKLYIIEMIVVYGGDNVLRHVIDEDTDGLILFIQHITPLSLGEG